MSQESWVKSHVSKVMSHESKSHFDSHIHYISHRVSGSRFHISVHTHMSLWIHRRLFAHAYVSFVTYVVTGLQRVSHIESATLVYTSLFTNIRLFWLICRTCTVKSLWNRASSSLLHVSIHKYRYLLTHLWMKRRCKRHGQSVALFYTSLILLLRLFDTLPEIKNDLSYIFGFCWY